MPRQSVHERAPPKRFDDECAAAEAECWVDVMRKKERQLDFEMAHQSVLFQVNEISSKSDGGSPNAKRKSRKQSFDCFKKEHNSVKKTKEF